MATEARSCNCSTTSNVSAPVEEPTDGLVALRVLISVVYLLVCMAGLLGNLLVLVLVKVRSFGGGVYGHRTTINVFIFNLAITDLGFVLMLPFWAADTLLDFSWPFGHVMCKLVLSVTVMNMYASVFFLTAMSVTRYHSVASALQPRLERRRHGLSAGWAVAALWAGATMATAPAAIFSTVRHVAGDSLCLLGFPEGGIWLALYHMQKILVGFVVPLGVVCASYLLLLRLLRTHGNTKGLRRHAHVTRAVAIIVLSFFLCWIPNQAVTLWGVLVKLNLLQWDRAYYVVHTYVHPLSVCLAHTNSCLNPLLYCLLRHDFRTRLRDMFRKVLSPAVVQPRAPSPPQDAHSDGIPLNNLDNTENC
ncbi:relaxin-3 receptor 1 [Corythoichthys intestinalis]|uniref:relaxin-3 receptor 1 n=1 Tax=Corythoichthys intestinalis TaxID=161448 RepID=UPI0025A64B9C|nr:relaxin-3 receptor 1 [Corythoichthys intestinalis]XP_061813003.1 relaxin-3 receptor 1-like [Nerophis lumbriciformis]